MAASTTAPLIVSAPYVVGSILAFFGMRAIVLFVSGKRKKTGVDRNVYSRNSRPLLSNRAPSDFVSTFDTT